MEYLFLDSDLAAHRLGVLARVYEVSTREFVGRAVRGRQELVVDLGCGPGHTTHLLASVLECARVIGLDSSERFVELARRSRSAVVSFLRHDVTRTPFPVGPADVLYCRFLLTHIEDPGGILCAWATQLREGGLLLIEEVDSISTTRSVFREYLEIVAAMLEARQRSLYVGPVLSDLAGGSGLECVSNDVRRLTVTNRDAAAMFHPNIRTWCDDPFVRANCDSETIDRLERVLSEFAAGPEVTSEIEWGLRQLVLRRT